MARDRFRSSEVIMSNHRLFVATLVGWPVTVALALTLRATAVLPALAAPEFAGWVFLGGAPLLVAFMIANGRYSRSVAGTLDVAHRAVGVRKPAGAQPRD
jgi:hypothetical protein